jgi:hypothetical protein
MNSNDHDDDVRHWWEAQHETIVPHVVPGEVLKLRARASSPKPNSVAHRWLEPLRATPKQ